jgi:glycosyltransferase involved in cell wall biosynthesis
MATADVSVIPSNSEAFGVVNLESLAMGTPVVASRVGGISEIVRDSIDGFLVPAGDAEALASKLGFLLSNPFLREQMGQNARKGFLERFELSRQASELSNWLEEITAASVGNGFRSCSWDDSARAE